MAGGFLDLLTHLIVAVEVEDISDKVKGILVILDVSVEAREVEAVSQIVFIDLAEVLIAPG